MMDVALEAAAETTENVYAKSQVRVFLFDSWIFIAASWFMAFIGLLFSYSGKDEKAAPAILQQDTGDSFWIFFSCWE